MFNLAQFRAQQKVGKASIFQTDTFDPEEDRLLYAVQTTQFDPVTGKRGDDQVIGVKHADLVARRDQLQAELDDLNAFIGEVEALAPAGKSIHDVVPAKSDAAPAEAAGSHE